MKKLIILTAAVLFSAVTLSARPTGFNIGGGFDYLGWTATNYSETPYDYVGPYIEVGYDLKVAKNSYIYFGGRFSHGVHVADVVDKAEAAAVATFNMGDLFIPIRFQQNFVLGPKNSTFYFEVGPAAGFLLYNYETIAAASTAGSGVATYRDVRDITYSGEPRANIYLGGNIGFNICRHVKIYAGGDYGFIDYYKSQVGNTTAKCNRWQLNFGAAYVF